MHIEEKKPKGSRFCLIFGAVSFLPVVIVFSLPLFIWGPHWWPTIIIFATMFFLPMFTCGLLVSGRPLFQSTYHGEHTPVMDEVIQEIEA